MHSGDAPRRTRWQTSSSTSGRAKYNLGNLSVLHKQLWKSQNLTSAIKIKQHCGDQERVGEGGAAQALGPADGGGCHGVRRDVDDQDLEHGGEGAGGGDDEAAQQYGEGGRPEHGGDCGDGGRGGDGGLVGGGGAQEAAVSHIQGGGGGEQSVRSVLTLLRRKYR